MSQRCFWKASVNSTYDTKVVLGVCGSILLKTKCGINSIHGKKKVTFIICLNLPTRASRNFEIVLTIYPWGEWKLCVCICWFTNTPLALMSQCTCRPGYTDGGRLCTGLFSIDLHFSSYFRHSIFLDSCLFKFSFWFFFYQTLMNARATAMFVT